MATQLYAKIKKSSEYFHQNERAKEEGQFPFPVEIRRDALDYAVKGGPGGQYKLTDVNLFALHDDGHGGVIEIKLS